MSPVVTYLLPAICFPILAHSLDAGETSMTPSLASNSVNVDYSFAAGVRHRRWADAAYDIIRQTPCKEAPFTTAKECRRLSRVPRSEMNIYVADPTSGGKLESILPDSTLRRAGTHDAVLAIDPYPKADFGHLVLVFFVDFGLTSGQCVLNGGSNLGKDGCLQLALKRRCRNLVDRRGRRRNFSRRCEVNFIPLVFLERDFLREQRLVCRSDIAGFAPCPILRPRNETSKIICDALRENTRRCETSHETVHTSCRIMEICDQAVILSGGFNRLGSQRRHMKNVWQIYRLLRDNGFLKKNIKVFFANGLQEGLKVDGESPHEILPAAMKHALRVHVRKMCDSPHCVDSLVFYLNNPARSDGSMLLWDVNGDGVADVNEIYTRDELLEDLASCHARQVHVLVDQSYSGELVRSIRRSAVHKNVDIFASSRDHEYSHNSEFTRLLTSFNHTHSCIQDISRVIRKRMTSSRPEHARGAETSKVTLFGAPCDVIPPFSQKELRQRFLGCQNLPTALWIMTYLKQQANSQGSNPGGSQKQTHRDVNTSGRGT